MADPRGRRLTLRHRRNLGRLTAQLSRQVRAVARRADIAAVAQWWANGADREVERIVVRGFRTAVELSTKYLQAHAAVNGAAVSPVPARLDLEAVRGSLFVASVGTFMKALNARGGPASGGGEIAAKRIMVDTLAKTATMLALRGDRETILATFRAGR